MSLKQKIGATMYFPEGLEDSPLQIAQHLSLVIFESVSFMRENLRGFERKF